MPYVSGFDCVQLMYCSWDTFVDEESIARLAYAFVNSIELEKYGVKMAVTEGHPSYDPKSFYKLYIYGSRKGIRSSRKLAVSKRMVTSVMRIKMPVIIVKTETNVIKAKTNRKRLIL